MNALFVVQADFLTNHVGVRRVILHYVAGLARAGVRVEFAAMRDGRLWVLRHTPENGAPTTLAWTSRVVRQSDYPTVVITNPWLCAEGLPDLPGCVGIVHDMVPNLIAAGCLTFSNTAALYRFACAHDIGYRYYLRNARRVCCVSESTQRDFRELYGPFRAGLEVITHVPFTPVPSAGFGGTGKRVLLVNVLDARKNPAGVARVLAQAAALTPLQVDIVGRERSAKVVIDDFYARLKQAGIRYRLHEDISDEALVALYRGAGVLLFPSLYEGLGLPVLEAQQEGLPVITTNLSSLPEINLNPDLCFAPDDERGMAQALAGVLTQSTKVLRGDSLRRALGVRLEKQISVADALGVRASSFANPSGEATPPAEFGRGLAALSAWEGSFLDFGSLSAVNRALTSALERRWGTPVVRVARTAPTLAAKTDPELLAVASRLSSRPPPGTQITIRHQWPADWSRPAQGDLVVIQPWEFGALPRDWVAQACQVQEFWVPSTYVRDVYVTSGIPAEKVHVVPNGIDPQRFHPGVAARPLATTKSFKFLFVGGTIHRKGPDVLLKAYLELFTAAEDVCLVIKDFGGSGVYAGQTFGAQIQAARARADAPEILYLDEELPVDDLPGLYRACDVLVHPYRGEGFGLPVLEAMACGLPVIVTAGGSTDDFATDDVAWRIPAVRVAIGDSISGIKLVAPGWWLEPDREALKQRMTWVVSHRAESGLRGMRAAAQARANWTWDHAAAAVERRLRELATVRMRVPVGGGRERKPASLTLPAVARLAGLAAAWERFEKKAYPAAWELTTAAIRLRPHHPEAYVLLAEIAKRVGDAASARRCAQVARRLAPGFKPAKKLLQEKLHGSSRPDWLVVPVQPAAPRLSVCLIVKNEERFIGQCLASVREVASQIVVVDTGSTDQTVAIARQFGAEIHTFAWADDFGAARNVALQQATGDWVLSLDADEELPVESHALLRRMLADEAVMGWRLPLVDIGRESEGQSYVPRLFRNAPGLCWVGRVHEQVFYSVEVRRKEWGLGNRLGDAGLRHHGYTPEVMRERGKVERNLRLLERAIDEIPDDPALVMNYGLELIRSDRIDEGLSQYRMAFAMMSQQVPATVVPETREALLTQYGTYLLSARRAGEVPGLFASPLARRSPFTASQHFVLGLALRELQQFSEAAEQLRACLAKRGEATLTPVNSEIRKVTPRHFLALSLWQGKEPAAAEAEFRLALEEDGAAQKLAVDFARFLQEQGQVVEALQLLNQFTSAYPTHAGPWIAGGRIALGRPELLEVALNWTDVAVNHHPTEPAMLAQRAEALLLAGDWAQALPLWTELSRSSDARALAAQLVCGLASGGEIQLPDDAAGTAISGEFSHWYWRLVEFGTEAVVLRLHARVEVLDACLPEAAAMVHSVISNLRVA